MLAGLATIIAAIWFVEWTASSIIGAVALLLLGLSFAVVGLVGNPGCEVTSLLNLLLSEKNRVHFV